MYNKQYHDKKDKEEFYIGMKNGIVTKINKVCLKK